MEKISDAPRNRLLIAVAILTIILYLSPILVLGEDSRVLIHDNLDGIVPMTKALADSGLIFARNDVPLEMLFNGIPRGYLGSEFSAFLWLFRLFPPFAAYALNLVFIHLIAFAGMYRLLRQHFLPDSVRFIAVGVALSFALLPFYPYGGLSVAGLPLVLDAFLTIRKGGARWYDWLILVLIPFYSSVVLTYMFFVVMLCILWLYDLVTQRRPNIRFGLAIVSFSLLFLLVEYRMVYLTLFDDSYELHRTEFATGSDAGSLLSVLARVGGVNWILGQYHVETLHTFVVLPAAVTAMAVLLRRRIVDWRLTLLLALTIGISVFYAIWGWAGLNQFKEAAGSLGSLNLGRIHWLHPLIWYLLFALSLYILSTGFSRGRLLVKVLLVVQILFVFSQNDHFLLRGRMAGNSFAYPTYGEFYATRLFEDVANYIGEGKDKYRVVSVGMHPAVSLYSGFYTLDGYLSAYPLAYKHSFRKIIASELENDDSLRRYYDNWGSRVYVFDNDLSGAMYLKDVEGSTEELLIDTELLARMGGRYVFSAVEIGNASDIGLELLKVFEREDAAWRVHLYQIANPMQQGMVHDS